jgi:hypothetical protein
VEYLAPLVYTYPRNSTLGLVWEDDDEEEEENEVVENEEQEEWGEKEGAVAAGFIFTLDDVMKSFELFLQLM